MPGYTWTLTRDQIIRNAFQRCGSIEEKDLLNQDQLDMGAEFLLILLKSFSLESIGISFTFPWVTQTIVTSSAVSGDTDSLPYRCIFPHISTATNRPTTGPEWPVYWASDVSVTGVPWMITTFYGTVGAFQIPAGTVGIDQAFLRYMGIDTKLDVISSVQYADIPNKSGPSKPLKIYMDVPGAAGFIIPEPDKISPDYVVRIKYAQVLEDVSSGTESPDFLRRGYRMLVFGLAYDLSFPLGVQAQKQAFLLGEYEKERIKFISADKEFRGQERKMPSCMVV